MENQTNISRNRISLQEFADHHNPKLTRRGHKMSASYLYRLIRQHKAGNVTRPLWFEYEMEGEKERIWIVLSHTENSNNMLPGVSLYQKYLQIASNRFAIPIDECRNRFGLFTNEQWHKLLGSEMNNTN